MRYSIVLPAVLAVANAAPAALVQREVAITQIPGIQAPGQCLPSGYYQAQDKGQPSSMTAVVMDCANTCAANSQCHAIVVQTQKAADSDLFTAQCFYYSSTPAPVTCAQGPSTIAGYNVGSGGSNPPTGSCSTQKQLKLSNIQGQNLNTGKADFSFNLAGTEAGCSTTCSATWDRSGAPPTDNTCADGTKFSLTSPNNSITDMIVTFSNPTRSVTISSGSGKYSCGRGSGNPVLSACSSSATFTTS